MNLSIRLAMHARRTPEHLEWIFNTRTMPELDFDRVDDEIRVSRTHGSQPIEAWLDIMKHKLTARVCLDQNGTRFALYSSQRYRYCAKLDVVGFHNGTFQESFLTNRLEADIGSA